MSVSLVSENLRGLRENLKHKIRPIVARQVLRVQARVLRAQARKVRAQVKKLLITNLIT